MRDVNIRSEIKTAKKTVKIALDQLANYFWLHWPKEAVNANDHFCSGCRTVSNNGSGLAPAQIILAVQVWFGFT